MPPLYYLQVLNLNLGQAGSAISLAHDAAVHMTPNSTSHRPASLVQPQIPAVTGAGVNGGEADDSATESETESDREEMCRKMCGVIQIELQMVCSSWLILHNCDLLFVTDNANSHQILLTYITQHLDKDRMW